MKKLYQIKVNGKTYKVELQAIEEVASKDAPKVEAKAAAPVAAAPAQTGLTLPELSDEEIINSFYCYKTNYNQ